MNANNLVELPSGRVIGRLDHVAYLSTPYEIKDESPGRNFVDPKTVGLGFKVVYHNDQMSAIELTYEFEDFDNATEVCYSDHKWLKTKLLHNI